MLQELIGFFQTRYAAKTGFQIICQPQGESGCKEALLRDLGAGVDTSPSRMTGWPSWLPPEHGPYCRRCVYLRGQNLSAVVDALNVGGTLHAYPLTVDNGYFLHISLRGMPKS